MAKLITISSRLRIPYLNLLGPILRPLSVTDEVCEKLQSLGYPVEIHESKDSKKKDQDEVTVVATPEDPSQADTVVEESQQVETIEEVVEVIEEPELLEVEEEEEVNTNSEEETEELYSDFLDEEGNLLVYNITEFKTWKKEKLVDYLEAAKEYLEEDEVLSISDLNKTEILELIKVRLI